MLTPFVVFFFQESGFRSTGRSLGGDDNYYGSEVPEDVLDPEHNAVTQTDPRVRVKLCLRSNPETCGDYTEADSMFFSISILVKFIF